jgi:hypothetical protein
MKDMGARINVGMAGLSVGQTFTGSRVGDIYLSCCNPEANVNSNCAPIVLRAVGCGSAYPESLWSTWLKLLYAMNDQKPPQLLREGDLKLESLPPGRVMRQHDDDAKTSYLNIRREDDGYRLWMADLWPFDYPPEGGMLLKPRHLNAGAWHLLEQIASMLYHPDVRKRSDEMAEWARKINYIPDNAEELMRDMKSSPRR